MVINLHFNERGAPAGGTNSACHRGDVTLCYDEKMQGLFIGAPGATFPICLLMWLMSVTVSD